MIASKLFGFPVDEQLLEVVISILRNDYHLVNEHRPSNNPESFVLVWEDDTGVGRYRVRLWPNYALKSNEGSRYDLFHFSYWVSKSRFDRQIWIQDPMKEPLQRVLALSEKRFESDTMFLEGTVEELEREIFAKRNYHP